MGTNKNFPKNEFWFKIKLLKISFHLTVYLYGLVFSQTLKNTHVISKNNQHFNYEVG